MSNRDYVFVRRHWISPDDDAIVIINRYISQCTFTLLYSHFLCVDLIFAHMHKSAKMKFVIINNIARNYTHDLRKKIISIFFF